MNIHIFQTYFNGQTFYLGTNGCNIENEGNLVGRRVKILMAVRKVNANLLKPAFCMCVRVYTDTDTHKESTISVR